MTKLSTAQVRMLEAIAGTTSRGSPFVAPKGPVGRPAKFLQSTQLIESRDGGLWSTDAGKAALAAAKGSAP